MEGSCFASKSSRQARSSELKRQRIIERGLTYPVYILTSTFNSPHLSTLQMALERQKISIAFQRETDILKRIPSTFNRQYFVVLNDFEEEPQLTGEFDEIQYESVHYPAKSIEEILAQYEEFVRRCQNSPDGRALQRRKQVGWLVESQDKQNSEQSVCHSGRVGLNPKKITCRNISKMSKNNRSSMPRRLFIYSTKTDDQHFKIYAHKMRQKPFACIECIGQVEEYLNELEYKGDTQYCVLMSQPSCQKYRSLFKRVDEILLYVEDVQKAVHMMKGKVVEIVSEEETLDKIIEKKMKVKVPAKVADLQAQKICNDETQTGGFFKVKDLACSSPTQASNYPAEVDSPGRLTSKPNTREENHKKLQLSSGIMKESMGLTSRVFDSVINEASSQQQVISPVSKTVNREEDSIPIPEISLHSIQSGSEQKIFGELLNQLSSGESQSSRLSSRTHKKSRVLAKIESYRKGERPSPPMSLIRPSQVSSNSA